MKSSSPFRRLPGTSYPTSPVLPAVFCLLLTPLALSAQDATPPDHSTSEAVVLPSFSVHDTRTSAYGATEATSTTRISTPIQDVPQTVSVVTREFMDDTGGFRMLDTAKYVTPILESSLTIGADRYTLRGFQISRRFVDGVTISGVDGYNMSSDTTNIERLEIIKGPNAILVPGGGPGGIMNLITKSPVFTDQATLSYNYKQYLENEASLDVNRVLDSKGNTAARVVLSAWDQENGYYRNYFRKGWLFAPSFTHRFGNDTQLTVKVESLYNKEAQGIGGVLDPSIGTSNGYARILPFIPRDWSFGGKDSYRVRWETRVVGELDFKIGDNTTSRLFLMADHATRDDRGPGGSGTNIAGTTANYNPLTGAYVPFTSFTYDPVTHAVTATPQSTVVSPIFKRLNQANLIKFDELHFKDDYATVMNFSSSIKNTLVTGISANYSRVSWQNLTATNANVDFSNLAATGTYDPAATVYVLNKDKVAAQADLQLFAYDQLSFWNDRLILTGGISEFYGTLSRLDSGSLPITNGPPNYYPATLSNSVTDSNLGLVYKPFKQLSFFGGYNKVGGALPSSITAGENPKNFLVQVGDQVEAGIKGTFFNGRLTFSSSYFNIKQDNFSTPNGAFILDPTQPQFIYYNVQSKGMEFEFNTLITPELALIGNYTNIHMRDAFGIPQAGVPENAAALFTKYTFHSGALKNFGMSLGADYMSKRAVNTATGFTAASTPANPIPYQPRAYLAPRTLFQAGLSYKWREWSTTVNIDNLFNKDYIQGGSIPALPRSFSVQLAYRFK